MPRDDAAPELRQDRRAHLIATCRLVDEALMARTAFICLFAGLLSFHGWPPLAWAATMGGIALDVALSTLFFRPVAAGRLPPTLRIWRLAIAATAVRSVPFLLLGALLLQTGLPLLVLAGLVFFTMTLLYAATAVAGDRMLAAAGFWPPALALAVAIGSFDFSTFGAAAPPMLLAPLLALLMLVFLARVFWRATAIHRRAWRDRTALAEAQGRAEKASSNKSAFVARMSHEIRTPLNGVLGCASLLGETDLDDRQRHLVAQITRSGDVLLTVLNDVLDLSRIEAGRLELAEKPFDVADAMGSSANLMAPLAQAKKLGFVTHLDNRLPQGLIGDGERLRQILMNLISNAIKFTNDGHICLALWDDGTDAEGRLRLLIEASDTGPGISDEARDSLFEPFRQLPSNPADRPAGSGLGLSICATLAHAMGGEIDCVPGRQRGTVMRVTLPMRLDAGTAATAALWRPELDGKRLLMIADLGLDIARYTDSLRALGLDFHLATSASDAIDVALDGMARGRPFDMVYICHRSLGPRALDVATRFRSHAALSGARLLLSTQTEPAAALADSKLFDTILTPARGRESLGATLAGLIRGQREDEAAPDLGGHRVLIVENEEDMGGDIEDCLAPTDAIVAAACDSRDAVELHRAVPADLVMIDLNMPRIAGVEVVDRIRAVTPPDHRVRIVGLIQGEGPAARERARQLALDGLIARPLVPATVQELAARQLLGTDRRDNPAA